MLQKIAKLLTRKFSVVILLAVLLLIPSVIGELNTDVNYDILSYLPEDLDSSKGQQILEDPFHMAAVNMLVVENMPEKYVSDLREQIEQIPGVSKALWIDEVLDISVPPEILPDEIKDIFFSDDNSTMIMVQYDKPGASPETMAAIDEIRAISNKQCFLSGVSVFLKDTKDLVLSEMPIYMVVAVILSMIALLVTSESAFLPVVFILGIGCAILYNMGTNVLLGEVSYITKAIAAILQLGVTTDYAIFLLNRYKEEKPKFADRRDAMASAIVSAFVSLSGSSLTTIAGFLALCFMQLGLGKDIGLVMAKGVLLGVITVVTVLPSIILMFEKVIEKFTHRSLMPNFNGLNKRIIKHSKVFVLLFLLLLVPSYYLQTQTQVYYNIDQSLPEDLPSTIATDKLKSQFNMATTHFIIVDDNLPSYSLKAMTDEIESVDGIEALISYDKFIGPMIPDDFVPQELKDMCKKDGKQIIMVNSSYKAATPEESEQINEITRIIKSYDENALLTGEGAMTKDLTETCDVDIQVTNAISIIAILLIVGFCFKSVSVPIILVAAIELSIFINCAISTLTGEVIPFISPIVINCIQLGATVDYAILMTTRFREELQNGHDKHEAILIASNTSDEAIITSALVLFCATFGVSLISKMEIIQSICMMLARGAIVSAIVSIFLLPSLLVNCEGLIAKTSLYWRTPKPEKEKTKAHFLHKEPRTKTMA